MLWCIFFSDKLLHVHFMVKKELCLEFFGLINPKHQTDFICRWYKGDYSKLEGYLENWNL